MHLNCVNIHSSHSTIQLRNLQGWMTRHGFCSICSSWSKVQQVVQIIGDLSLVLLDVWPAKCDWHCTNKLNSAVYMLTSISFKVRIEIWEGWTWESYIQLFAGQWMKVRYCQQQYIIHMHVSAFHYDNEIYTDWKHELWIPPIVLVRETRSHNILHGRGDVSTLHLPKWKFWHQSCMTMSTAHPSTPATQPSQ